MAIALAAAFGALGLAACDRGEEGSPDAMDQTGEVRPGDVQPGDVQRSPAYPDQAGDPAQQGAQAQGGSAQEDPMGGMQLEDVEFGALDEDGDGYISQQEAEALPVLAENFDRYDTAGEGRLDESEFAVFLEDLQGAGELPHGGAGTTPGHTGVPPDRRVDGVEPDAMEPGAGEGTGPTDRGLDVR